NEEPISARTEEFHAWHKPAAEARASNGATPLSSKCKLERGRTKLTEVSSTENKDGEDGEGTIKKSEGEVEQFGSSTITLISANEEIDDSDRSWTEANSRKEMKETGILDETRWSTTAVHTGGNTKAKSSNHEEGEKEEKEKKGKEEAAASSNLSTTLHKSTLTLSKEKENDVLPPSNVSTYLQGCVVTFQADPHSKRPAESSAGFQASTIARTAEVCAGRCYQDGCTGAKYDPSSKECVLGYSGKQICNNGPEHFFYEANETIWIHCTGCSMFMFEFYEKRFVLAKLLSTEAQKVKTTKADQTPEKKLGAATDITRTSSTTEIEESVNKEKISITTTPLQNTVSDHDCIVSFQVRPIDVHSKELAAEFIPTDTSTVNECARRCYMDGCTGAKFNSVNGECLLTFEDHHQCDENEQQQHSLDGIETLWIHCISCKKQFTESTLGLLAQDETNLPVITKESKENENSATNESFSTSKFAEVEENFLTSVTPDVGLESTKKVKSELVIDSDETNDKIVIMAPELSAELESTVKGDEKIPFVTPLSFGNGSLFEAETKEQEVKSKESEGEFDTSPIVATVEEEASRSSILQSSVESSTKHLEVETTSTAADIMETFAETNGNNELDITVQPDLLISLTLQTPLNVPTDSSELLDITEEISGSSVVSTVAMGSATISQTSMINSGEWEDQKEEAAIEFQEEVEPTTVSAEITVTPIFHREVTDDVVGTVASIVANISHNVLETDVKETIRIPEESSTETHEIISTIASKNAIIGSHIEATSDNFKGTLHSDIKSSIVEETALMESNVEAPGKAENNAALSDITNATTAEAISEATFIAEETSTSTSNERNIEVTFRILEKTFGERNNDDEDLFSKSASNSIMEQPFVQKNVDAVIKNVAQSKDILVTGIKLAVGDAAVQEEAIKKVEEEEGEIITEVAKDLSNNNKLVIQGEHMTTEPPVQAVSDLISVLSQNSKIEEVIGRNRKENGAFIVDDVNLTKDIDEQIMTTNVPINQFQEDFIGNSLQNSAKIRLVEGTPARCLGRVEFEISEMEDLSQLDVTSEIMIESPAACAMKCYETVNCVLAVYKPSQNDESTNAVCMLTADSAICSPEEKFIPQHKSGLSALVISCLRCTKCHYSISMVTELTRIQQAETVEPALSIGQCGEICWKHNCTVAQYDHRSNLKLCNNLRLSIIAEHFQCSLISMKGQQECPQETPIAVNGDEPVLLECVRCFI
uniref:PAN domain-containing protein n=1 Tax=Wuchereria bancrofti TaxID=6293 RepID=A0A1I8ED05_WUCBA